jgi:hypothetical protein
MAKSIPDSNAGAPQAATGEARGVAAAARTQRFRVDEVLREIGRRGRLSSHGAPIAWGLCGFLIGGIFWHHIGVWGFLGAVVLKEPAVSVVARQQPVIVARQRVQPVVLPNCTVLVLDRSTGETSSVSCPDLLPVFEEARRGRQDLALAEIR